MKSNKIKIYVIVMAVLLILSSVFMSHSYAESSVFTGEYGNHYIMLKAQFLYKKAGGKGGKVLRKSLPKSERANCIKGLKYAKFKAGTEVTCLQESGKWIRVTSHPKGWIKNNKNTLDPIL